jgi:ribonuclease P protein component
MSGSVAQKKIFSLKKSERLSAKDRFREILAGGKKISAGGFTLKFKNNELGYPRIGIVLAKKKFPVRPGATPSSA